MTQNNMTLQEQADAWKKKALEAVRILERLSQPPFLYATVVSISDTTVDVAFRKDELEAVSFDSRLKKQLKQGQSVRISPETRAIVAIDERAKPREVASVKEVLSNGYIQINYHGVERVIPTCVAVRSGDKVLTDFTASIVIEKLGNSSNAYHLERVPPVSWSSIGGLETTIEEIRDAVELPFKYPALYKKFPNKKQSHGILLYGPPGCGKTMLGKAIAYNLAEQRRAHNGGALNGYFMYLAGPELLQKWVGDGEAKVREIFASARETASKNGDPVVIFIDEPESVLKQRGTSISSDASDPIVNQLLAELDGMQSRDNIYLVLATNRH